MNRSDFLRVRKQGERFHTAHFVVLVADGPGVGHHRLGITCGRKAGNAVRRNRIKRLLREYFRLNKKEIFPHLLETGADIVVIVRPDCPNMKLEDVEMELNACGKNNDSADKGL